jgi:putative multiple sugar transport system substrate-binding protein
MRFPRLAAATVAALALVLAGCGSSEKTADQQPKSTEGALIGVTMPTRASERWIRDGDNVRKALEDKGYKVDLQYAENDIPTQANQIENQITKGARALIIASIDAKSLSSQLQAAADAKIPVISYDRLLLDSPNVDYYASFDNFKVGVQQATSLLTGLKVLDADGGQGTERGPLNIELFAGSSDDNNSSYFYDGAMSVLRKYLDDGTLVVASGQKDFKTMAILRWDPATAQRRMEDLLTSTYGSARVDGVLSPYDGISIGILSALRSGGYGVASQPYPIVTGQDAEVASVKSIVSGEQYSTIFKDIRELAKAAANMADAVIRGSKPEVNNTKDYDNGEKVVPAILLQPVIVEKSNYVKELVDSGYYTADQLK